MAVTIESLPYNIFTYVKCIDMSHIKYVFKLCLPGLEKQLFDNYKNTYFTVKYKYFDVFLKL